MPQLSSSSGPLHPVSAVAGTLFSGEVSEVTEFDQQLAAVASEWQSLGADSAFEEIRGITRGVEQNRPTELVGRIAAAGEQLGLAGAANRDARSWRNASASATHATLTGRALAEVTGYFALAAAHGLVNVTARLHAFESRTQEALRAASKWGTEDFAPFAEKPGHWLPFNAGAIGLVRTSTTHHPSAQGLVEILENLNEDTRWKTLMKRRNNDFHRWRPQSISGGVAPTTQWQDAGDGVTALVAYQGNAYSPAPVGGFIAEASEGLEALVDAMEAWSNGYLDALQQVLTFTLAARYGEEL